MCECRPHLFLCAKGAGWGSLTRVFLYNTITKQACSDAAAVTLGVWLGPHSHTLREWFTFIQTPGLIKMVWCNIRSTRQGT